MSRGAFLILVTTLLSFSASSLSDESTRKYTVRLSRPAKVGDRYHVNLKGRRDTKTELKTISGQVVLEGEEVIDVELAALAEVQAVDSKQQETRVAYTIENCTKTMNRSTSEVLKKGRVVVVEYSRNGITFTVDGKGAKEKVIEALSVVLSAREPDAPTSDEIFGTGDQKSVGSEWDINAEAAARLFKSDGIKAEPSNINGTSKLLGTGEYKGLNVLQLESRIHIKNAIVSSLEDPKEPKSSVEMSFREVFIADPESSRRVAESRLLAITYSAITPNAGRGELVGRGSYDLIQEANYSPAE